ncbi:MAG TPA: hypothetical protein VGB87_06030, partial [Vicinamibacteria bacterium]
ARPSGVTSAPLAGRAALPSGDPAKLARALIVIASQEPPPRRFVAGADAIGTAEQKVADLKAQIEANRDLSTSLAPAREDLVLSARPGVHTGTIASLGDTCPTSSS